jgi:Flp pilus assembly protein TadB
MRIVVAELAIEDAVGRARQRLREADERLSRTLADRAPGLFWMGLGALATVAGLVVLIGVFPLSADAMLAVGVLPLVLGGAFMGCGLARWSRSRRLQRQHERQWQHALNMLRLREEQAREDPTLTVEVLEHDDGRGPALASAWRTAPSASTKYVQ